MNSNDTTKETVSNLQAEGHAIMLNELGCHEDWDKNQRKAENAGKPWCVHCGRAIDLDTAWAIHRFLVPGHFWSIAIEPGFEDGIKTDLVLLGSTCGPKVMKSERSDNRFLIPAKVALG